MATLNSFSVVAVFLIIIVCFQIKVFQSFVIKVSTGYNHKRHSEHLNISNCSNLGQWSTNISSIHTNNNCIQLYDKFNCSGHSVELLPHSPAHNNLEKWGFDKRTKSIGPCSNPCRKEATGNLPNGPFQVDIFSEQHYIGESISISVHGCTIIPVHFVNRTKSIKTYHQCVQMYNNTRCEMMSEGFDHLSIEIRPNTPHHDEIPSWGFSSVRAISHCTYKCFNNSSTSKQGQDIFSAQAGDVYIFDQTNFQGTPQRLELSNSSCLNLKDHRAGFNLLSIKISNKTCLNLYNELQCVGNPFKITSSVADFSNSGLIQSLELCKSKSNTMSGRILNKMGSTKKAEIPYQNTLLSAEFLSIIIMVPFMSMVASVILALYITRKCRYVTGESGVISSKEIQEFRTGLELESLSNANTNDYSVELLAGNNPYNESYEIARSRIQYDCKKILGMGQFGVVCKGTVSVVEDSEERPQKVKRLQVAIKTVKKGEETGRSLQSLLKEAKVMIYVGKHDNVAALIGCCTENLNMGEILVLVEYCSNGSLESYVLKNRTSFKNIVSKGKIEKGIPYKNECYQNLDLDKQVAKSFGYFQLLEWCIEVARGMEFLARSKVVHSDLAARNVLLTEGLTAKISDFGLSRQLYTYSEYVKKNQEPLPWRWMALESLKDLQFSSMSDIWSFGVLCWEIFTLGEKPYPGMSWSATFISSLEDGLRLAKPKYSTTDCYNAFFRCWEESPLMRPTFGDIIEELEKVKASSIGSG